MTTRTPRLTAFGIVAEAKKLLGVTTDDEILPAISALIGGKSKAKVSKGGEGSEA